MSISSETRKAGPFSCNGSTAAFPFQFKVFQASDVVVVHTDQLGVESTLTLGTHYTVSLKASQDTTPGGTITTTTAYPSGHLVTLTSGLPNLQPTVLTNLGGFYPQVINDALDRLTILVQQLAEKAKRSLAIPISSSSNSDDLLAELRADIETASASAILARDWANKTSGPVDSVEFSAKHYANLAAQGVRLSTPVGSVAWWPKRSSIQNGQIPGDGQTISRATYPDLSAMVVSGLVPVVTEAEWLADPLKRGSYTLGDGSTTIRVPDYNGKSVGSVGALFLRGDGALSNNTNGLIQRDALQNITGSITSRSGPAGSVGTLVSSVGAFSTGVKAGPSGISFNPFDSGTGSSDVTSFDASRVARTAAETRPQNVTGVWIIQAFGAVTNPGSADAAQLATDYATLNAAFQAVRGQVFGVGQSYQEVTGSRAFDLTVYTNTTGRPIVVHVGFNLSGSGLVEVQIRPSGATSWIPGSLMGWPSAINGMTMMCVIAAGASYRMQKGNAVTISNVWEYR